MNVSNLIFRNVRLAFFFILRRFSEFVISDMVNIILLLLNAEFIYFC